MKRIRLRDLLQDCDGVPTVVVVKLGRGRSNQVALTKHTVIDIEGPTELLFTDACPNGFSGWVSDLPAAKIIAAANKLQRSNAKRRPTAGELAKNSKLSSATRARNFTK